MKTFNQLPQLVIQFAPPKQSYFCSGRITKAGRRDLRWIMVEAANHAARHHPHWQAEMARLEPRLGRNKAIVAIARKLLIAVWHVLTDGCADRYADAESIACSLFGLAYKVGVRNLPGGQSAKAYCRAQLDRLKIGSELEIIPWGTKKVKLPKSRLAAGAKIADDRPDKPQ